ncbi:MAG: twin-arginine translocase TatA/TatE family subunit [Anaerolineae bacterium]|nr:twin-arginine translocase TatA/TatE family subunit [Anaerolineae bacterium]MDK1117194.1 twin-arginine translocase TatA/TatE family subunit [Anaerolineae bacterium]
MAWRPGLPELIIILVVVLLLFGPGRIAKIAGELGKGIRSFKRGVEPDQEEKDEPDEPEEAKSK